MTMKEAVQTIYLKDYQAPDFQVDKLDLEIELGEEFTLVTSRLVIHSTKDCNKSDLVLDGECLELKSIAMNGKTLTSNQYLIAPGNLRIYNVPKTFSLIIQTIIKPQENTALTGLYKSLGNFCTQCEAQGFRYITYFLDRPDVMTRFSTKIIADKKRYPILLSNGNRTAAGELDNGRHWVQWEDPYKKPSYLFALVAGDFEFIEDYFITQSGRRVTLQVYVEKGNLDKCAHAMQALKKAMRWDEVKYGREYDLDIYMIVGVSDFNMGAMENKGLNIFNTKYILANPQTATDIDFIQIEAVIAHEYFHNWTGNRITCRDWFQLSLKEGLTVFRDQNFTMDTTSRTVARIQDVDYLRESQFSEDAGPLAHPVQPQSYIEIDNFYTATVYNKGAEVIRMMLTMLGENVFRKAMDLYFMRHDGQAVTIEEFVKSMEDASQIDLQQFRLWYTQAGTPVLTVEDNYDQNNKIYTLTIKQFCPPTPQQPHKKAMHIPVKIGLLDSTGKEIHQEMLHVKHFVETFQFKNIDSKPIPSLLREFSAPVKVNYPYTDAELLFLFTHDTDKFNRSEAGQKYAVKLILKLIHDYRQNKPLEIPKEFIVALQTALKTLQDDKLFLIEMISLPSEQYLSEQMSEVDVDAIHFVREFFIKSIAEQAKNELLQVYELCHDAKPYEFNMEEVGKRGLKNIALTYLTRLPEFVNLAVKQFNVALTNNMSDTMGALRGLVHIDSPQREEALNKFYETWQQEALVVDKWLSLQATSKLPGTLNKVKELFRHKAFDIKNPNKVYALVGAFTHSNLFQFHAENGEGYAFLAQTVLELDKLNPHTAARMVKPLTSWRRYDKNRQNLMRKQLEMLLQHKLSKYVFELVSKSLEETVAQPEEILK